MPGLELEFKKGYWIRNGNSVVETITVSVIPQSTYTINLAPGWNLIGSVSGTANAPLMTYDKDGNPVTGILQGKGYWVRNTSSGTTPVTITATSTPAPSSQPTNSDLFVFQKEVPTFRFPIHVESKDKSHQLTLGWDEMARPGQDRFDQILPPPPPPIDGVLNAHFEQSSLQLQQDVRPLVEGTRWAMRIITNEPVKLQWNKEALPDGFTLIASTPFSSVDFRETDVLVLPQGKYTIPIRLTYHLLPTESKLLVNFPNPFNPETWLPYQLAEANPVTITIYNVNGELIRTLPARFQATRLLPHSRQSRPLGWAQC